MRGQIRGLRMAALALVFALIGAHAEAEAKDLAQSALRPPSSALVSGGSAIVKSVIDGDTVILDREISGSREVRLVGLQAPKLPLGRDGFREWPLAKEAKAALEVLVQGRTVELGFGGTRMDRHKRHLAHLTRDDGVWIQGAMLEAGMARVYSFADNRARVADMLARERAARQARRGIWSNAYYAIRTSEKVAKYVNSFELVEGTVLDAAVVSGRAYLNFGENWRTDFTVTIAARALRQFKLEGLGPDSYKGRRIRVRGWLQSRDGPMIEATHPDQIEVLDP
jgi:endonuclease YncB( thermonuclease family)